MRPSGRARFRVRARRVARVVHAETARVRPGTEPHPCVSPRRRVADLQACAHPTLTLDARAKEEGRAAAEAGTDLPPLRLMHFNVAQPCRDS